MSDKSKVSAAVADLATKLGSGITITIDGNSASAKIEGNPLLDNLPEGITREQAEQLHTHATNVYSGLSYAFGTKATDALKKHSKVDSVVLEAPLIGKDTWTMNYSRSKTYPAGPAGGEPVTRYGVIDAKLEVYAARGKVGEMKIVREEIGAAALAAFGK